MFGASEIRRNRASGIHSPKDYRTARYGFGNSPIRLIWELRVTGSQSRFILTGAEAGVRDSSRRDD
jgi:hypothetical protein